MHSIISITNLSRTIYLGNSLQKRWMWNVGPNSSALAGLIHTELDTRASGQVGQDLVWAASPNWLSLSSPRALSLWCLPMLWCGHIFSIGWSQCQVSQAVSESRWCRLSVSCTHWHTWMGGEITGYLGQWELKFPQKGLRMLMKLFMRLFSLMQRRNTSN